MPKHLTSDDTTNFVTSGVVGQANGVAQLGADGKVPNAQLPAVLTGSVDSVNGKIGNVSLNSDDVGAVALSQKGQVNGVPQLDSTGRMPVSQLPSTVVQTTSLGVANGVATLDSGGKLTAAQVPTAPVTSVNSKTGSVTLTSSDVGAIPTTQRAAANGVATLDDNTTVPLAQIPSLVTLYQPVPGATPAKPNQILTAIAGGSNSAQWSDPPVYVASSAAAMPVSVPTGSLCVRTDISALYMRTATPSWVALVPNDPGWTNLPLPTGTRGYSSNDAGWLPRYRRIGNQVWIRGRIELTSGAIFQNAYTITLPDEIHPTYTTEAVGTSTTAGTSQLGVARWQINTNGAMSLFCGTGPVPNSPWLGFNFTYMID